MQLKILLPFQVFAEKADVLRVVAEFANALDCLLVTSCPDEDRAPAYSRAHALIRQPRNPVLVTGGG